MNDFYTRALFNWMKRHGDIDCESKVAFSHLFAMRKVKQWMQFFGNRIPPEVDDEIARAEKWVRGF
jgi:hypothetical protein